MVIDAELLIFCHSVSPSASVWIQTLELRIVSRVLHHCATVAQP